jgi:hypothetical protein
MLDRRVFAVAAPCLGRRQHVGGAGATQAGAAGGGQGLPAHAYAPSQLHRWLPHPSLLVSRPVNPKSRTPCFAEFLPPKSPPPPENRPLEALSTGVSCTPQRLSARHRTPSHEGRPDGRLLRQVRFCAEIPRFGPGPPGQPQSCRGASNALCPGVSGFNQARAHDPLGSWDRGIPDFSTTPARLPLATDMTTTQPRHANRSTVRVPLAQSWLRPPPQCPPCPPKASPAPHPAASLPDPWPGGSSIGLW